MTGGGEPATGTVEDVTLRVTRMRSPNGEVITVPNGAIAKVVNLSRDWARAVVDVPIPTTVDVNRVNEILREVGREAFRDPGLRPLLLDPPSVMGVESLDLEQVNVRMVARTLPGKQFEVGRDLRARVVLAFREQGLSVPPPPPVATQPTADELGAGGRAMSEPTQEQPEVTPEVTTAPVGVAVVADPRPPRPGAHVDRRPRRAVPGDLHAVPLHPPGHDGGDDTATGNQAPASTPAPAPETRRRRRRRRRRRPGAADADREPTTTSAAPRTRRPTRGAASTDAERRPDPLPRPRDDVALPTPTLSRRRADRPRQRDRHLGPSGG